MIILIALDDTGNDRENHTGHVLRELGDLLEENGLTGPGRITAHPLMKEESLSTGQNRAFCLRTEAVEGAVDRLTAVARSFVDEHSGEGSRPGLCIVLPEILDDRDRLINFGAKCLKNIVTPEQARVLADRLTGVFLSEHGAGDAGMIGALAAAAFRLEGEQGIFFEPVRLPGGDCPRLATVGELLELEGIDLVLETDGRDLELSDPVSLTGDLQPALHKGRAVLWVRDAGDLLIPLMGARPESGH